MQENRPGYKSMSRYAWIAPAIILLALGLIYLADNDEPDRVQTLEATVDFERVRMGHPDQHGKLQRDQTLSATTRRHVVQNLSGFRADHKVVGPTITVTAIEASGASRDLAKRIGGLLAQHNLGRYAEEPETTEMSESGGGRDGVVLFVRRTDRSLAQGLITALAPMLSGTVTIQFNDERRAGQLLLAIVATPGFTDEGVAVFPSAG